MAKRHIMYNHEIHTIEKKEARGEVFVIRPPESLKIGRVEKDPEELRRVYAIGRREAERQLDKVRAFLSAQEPVQRGEKMDRKIRRHYHFFGRVQGVGFRFQAMMAAESLGLTGWVHNEADGSVTMEIQGSEEEIEAAVSLIKNSRYIRIEKTLCEEIELEEKEYSFGADYW